jgi:hypothetical protein
VWDLSQWDNPHCTSSSAVSTTTTNTATIANPCGTNVPNADYGTPSVSTPSGIAVSSTPGGSAGGGSQQRPGYEDIPNTHDVRSINGEYLFGG